MPPPDLPDVPGFEFSPWKKRKETGEARIIELKDAILGRNRVEIIGHAQERMRDWGLTDEDALKVLRQPDVTGLPTDEGRKRYRRHKTIRFSVDVVFEETPDAIVVITIIKKKRH